MQKRDFSQSPLKVFFSYYGPHKKLFTLDIIMALLGVAADLVFPWATRHALQALLPDRKYVAFFTVMAVLFAAYILRSLTVYIVTVFGHELGVRVEADMRSDIFRHVQQLSFSFFDTHRTGKLMSRMTTDLFEITELAHHGPENVLQAGLTLIGAIVILMTVRWELALVLLIMLPLLLAVVISLRLKLRNASKDVKQETAEINAAVEGGVSGARTVKAFANESVEMEKFRVSNERFKKSKRVYYRRFGLFNSATEFTVAAMQVVVFAPGGYYIMKGRMDLADLVAFSLYVSIFTSPIRKLIFFVEQFETGRAGFERFLEIMRTPAAVEDAPDAKELESVTGDVEYRDVGFHYENGPPVIEHVDLHIAPGETLALVGPSGSGKTTLSQLLPRFYDVTEGAVLVDGQDIRSVTQASLRRHIGMIQQDVFLFADTVRENIRYGRPDATDEEVAHAAMLAAIHDEILAMPEGYNSFVGERGVMLSGGQKQRIALARVFLKNPPILVLDEATSALDSVTEAAIQRSLEELSSGRTVIVVAHRLSTIRNADHIAVIENEHVAEYGTHEELLSKGGLYAGLWNTQKLM
ncbi:MAG: ABC transporter ATP-binding protein [Oscillospiraceae bacterium]|nr:ABC transporter ATP-binding protein [Oscillospiraceae bacterium]